MRITSKGQVTIPAEIRERFGFMPNSCIDFIEEEEKIYIVKSAPSFAGENPFDFVRGKADKRMSTEDIMKLTRFDE